VFGQKTSEDPKRRRFSDNSDDQKPCGNQRTQGGDKWVVKCDCGVLIGFYVKVIFSPNSPSPFYGKRLL